MMYEQTQGTEKCFRYAIYARYSSEMQTEISLEAQEACCREAIGKRGGAVVAVYTDSAKTGWSLEREGFNGLRLGAERGEFDAVMFWKFDRLARNHEHAVLIKMLLRHEYGLKLYCVEGFSEDDDDSFDTAMMEQLLAVFAAFYSRNLSSETKRGKRQRAINGEFNGSKPPLGYDLVLKDNATPECSAGLHLNPRVAALVRRAFRMYAIGNYSDADIAQWLNQRPTIAKLRQGHQPINKEMVRDMLQNRTYTGRVRYTDTIYKGSLGEHKTSKRHRSEWFEGKHIPLISDELFEACSAARSGVIRHKNASSKERVYLLHDRVYCANCIANRPQALVDANFGRMRPKFQNQHGSLITTVFLTIGDMDAVDSLRFPPCQLTTRLWGHFPNSLYRMIGAGALSRQYETGLRMRLHLVGWKKFRLLLSALIFAVAPQNKVFKRQPPF
jgi:site-specific DNA recombinase